MPKLVLLLLILFPFTMSAAAPVAVYLTWAQDPTSTMCIRWLTKSGIDEEANAVSYRQRASAAWQTQDATCMPFPGEPYTIHAVELLNLASDTEYEFQLACDPEKSYRFVTMPKELSKPIVFVEGGDTSAQGLDRFRETGIQAARTDPLFILFGGDLAYSSSNKIASGEDRIRWIHWLSAYYETMITPSGRMIPVLATIGNHDIPGKYGQGKEAAVCYYALFPMPGNPSYNVLRFGDYLSLYFLDSGHTSSVAGPQTEWLGNELQKESEKTNVLVAYHFPAYPSVRAFRGPLSTSIRRHWVPLFDRYRVDLVFEHHEHSYKRTHPLLHDDEDPHGIIYVGDGAWGAKARTPKDAAWTTYLAKTSKTSHFLKVELSQKRKSGEHSIECWAISNQGIVFDHFTAPSI
jgi:hypothetical protein